MTKKKDLKKRVRERQAKTGESYAAALAQVRGKSGDGPQITVAPDATREARAAGLQCTAVVSRRLREERDLSPLFLRLRELLEALGARVCGPLLRGEPGTMQIHGGVGLAVEAQRFLASVRAGLRGLSDDERLFALEWDGRVVLGQVVALGSRRPLLTLGLLEDAHADPALSLMGLGR